MEDHEEYSKINLERCSYRFLQQTAKALHLPSNVKKVYLIQLIFTQKYRSQEEVEDLVKQVRLERQQQALVRRKAMRRKKHVQSTEVSSTSNSQSPPITNTPKRVGHILIRYSPEQRSPIRYPRTVPTRTYPLIASDRVLRSSNRVKKPSYLISNSLMSLYNAAGSEERSETRINILSKEKYRKINRGYVRKKISDSWRTGRELVPVQSSARTNISSQPPARRQRRLSGIYPLKPEDIQLPSVSVRRADGTLTKLKAIIQKPLTQLNYNYNRLTNRNRSLLSIEAGDKPHTASNISDIATNMHYRIPTISEIENNLDYGPNISELVSLGYKSSNVSEIVPSSSYNESNMTEITKKLGFGRPNISESTTNFDYRMSNMSEIVTSLSYRPSNISDTSSNLSYRAPNNSLADTLQPFNYSSPEELSLTNTYKDNNNSEEYSVYYHKKIRAEQVRSLRNREATRCTDNECRLPKIGEVFSKFNTMYCRDVTQPVYVQIDSEPDIAPTPNIPSPRVSQSSSLEKLYNLKTNQSLLQIATTCNTRTVYCTPVISTAKAQPSTTAAHNLYNIASPRDSQPSYFMDEDIPRVHDFFRNFRCDEDIHDASTVGFRRSSSSESTLTSQEQDLGANVTIPEMVEDALELISQDGDYMERMGMDIRMQCILCNWAGPKIILEYHIRKEHSFDIIECTTNEWCATYTLGGLAARRTWFSRLLEHSGTIYVLSAKYEDPDYFMASLMTLSSNEESPKSGSMTIYNKVTGEPFTWQGDITELPPTVPYDDAPHSFRLQLSRMNLLPNSANLKLLNRELVTHSPTKVVVGQPELDSIHICLMVKIFD